MIISLRQFYQRKRLMETRNRPRKHILPQERFYEKLQFLNTSEMENFNVKNCKNQPINCNSQINCSVEDTFLLSNSQKSIHSEQVDLGLHYSLDEDYTRMASLGIPENNNSIELPIPPTEFQEKKQEIRAVSGNDRPHYRDVEEYDGYRKHRNRAFKMQRRSSNYSTASRSIANDSCKSITSNRTPKGKVLTRRYAKPNSRQRLVEYVYACKLNGDRQNSHLHILNPIFVNGVYRRKSGNDDDGGAELDEECRPHCTCCPNYKKQKAKPIPKDEYIEEDGLNENDNRDNDQASYQQRNSNPDNQNEMSYQNRNENEVPTEYRDPDRDAMQQENYDKFQSPEPTSEDNPPKCCRPDNCPVFISATKQAYSHRQDKYRDDVDDIVDEQPSPSRQSEQKNRFNSEPTEEEYREREEPKESSRREYKQSSRQASVNTNRTGYGSRSGQKATHGTKLYCTANKNHMQQGKMYVECPYIIQNPNDRGQMSPRRGTGNTYQSEYVERRIDYRSNRSSRNRSERDGYESPISRGRQKNDQNDERFSENSRYDNTPHAQIRSSQDSDGNSFSKYTARTSTMSNQRKYLSEEDIIDDEDQDGESPRNGSPINYEPRQPILEEYLKDDDCTCSTDEEYADDNRSVVPTADQYPQGNENQMHEYQRVDCPCENFQEVPRSYRQEYNDNICESPESPKRRSKDSRKGRKDIIEYCLNDCPQSCDELCPNYVYEQEYRQFRSEKSPKQSGDSYKRLPDERNSKYDDESTSSPKRRSHSNRDVAVETEYDMNFNKRGNAEDATARSREQSKVSESVVENETDTTNANQTQSKALKVAKKKNLLCKCVPDKQPKPKGKQRSSSPAGGKCTCSVKRLSKSEDIEDELQSEVVKKPRKSPQTSEEPGPHEKRVNRQPSGYESRLPNAGNKLRGMSVLGTFQVPPVLAEKTINIVKKHITKLSPMLVEQGTTKLMMSNSYQNCIRPVLEEALPKSMASTNKIPVGFTNSAPSREMKGPVMAPSNPFRNINFNVSKRNIIILHPPAKDFRPSKNSFDQDEVVSSERHEHDATKVTDV
ncbi:GATA zinc finger domain-containing protein 14 isoform X2 [Drosophila albomicans]|nr:GATA zinc finger domain-containing protein 14 isoform X2 [Drosophila albomicans]